MNAASSLTNAERYGRDLKGVVLPMLRGMAEI